MYVIMIKSQHHESMFNEHIANFAVGVPDKGIVTHNLHVYDIRPMAIFKFVCKHIGFKY